MARRTLLALAAVTALLACDASLTVPPHGLPVALTRSMTLAPSSPQFAADGDSVIITMASWLLFHSPCAVDELDAGLDGLTLVITQTSRVSVKVCTAMPTAMLPTTRLVVHDVPSGSFGVLVAQHVVSFEGGTTDEEVARGRALIP